MTYDSIDKLRFNGGVGNNSLACMPIYMMSSLGYRARTWLRECVSTVDHGFGWNCKNCVPEPNNETARTRGPIHAIDVLFQSCNRGSGAAILPISEFTHCSARLCWIGKVSFLLHSVTVDEGFVFPPGRFLSAANSFSQKQIHLR